MKLKLKLKDSELTALTAVLEDMIFKNDPGANRHEVIVALLVLKIYKKLKEKCALIDKKNYSISVDPEQALAFLEFFQGIRIPVTSFAGNLTHKIITQFYKDTSTLTT